MATRLHLKCSHGGCGQLLQLVAKDRDGNTTWICEAGTPHESTYKPRYIQRFVRERDFPLASLPSKCNCGAALGRQAANKAIDLGEARCGKCQQVWVLNRNTGFWEEG